VDNRRVPSITKVRWELAFGRVMSSMPGWGNLGGVAVGGGGGADDPVAGGDSTSSAAVAVAYALSLPTSGHLIDFYGRSDEASPDEVQHVTLALEAANARTWAEPRVRHHLQAARSQLAQSELTAERQIPLLALADLVTARSR
jgi:hypothetical protein